MLSGQVFDYGSSLTIAMSDRVVECLANGAVDATILWILASGAPHLIDLHLQYELPHSDGSRQISRIGPAFINAEAVTCLEAAIYHAAWMCVNGVPSAVCTLRGDTDTPGHAVVMEYPPNHPPAMSDPTKWLKAAP